MAMIAVGCSHVSGLFVQPLFTSVWKPMGRASYIGPAGSGQIAKLANQIMVACNIASVAQGLLFAGAGGADPAQIPVALAGGHADSRALQEHGRRMIKRDFRPGAPIRNFVKDLDTVLATAKDIGIPQLPMVKAVRDVFKALRPGPRAVGPQRIPALSGEAERARAPHQQSRYATRVNPIRWRDVTLANRSARFSRRDSLLKCPKRRHENEEGAKFCEECAAPLGRAKCGRPLSTTPKFCPECAHPTGLAPEAPATTTRFTSRESYTPKHLAEKILTSRAVLEGERRQVTVLFADLKGPWSCSPNAIPRRRASSSI
jgi:hypothetical protein